MHLHRRNNMNKWDKQVKVEENGYYWKKEPIINKRTYKKTQKPVIVELFSGCGGTSKGFEMAGYDALLGVDIHQPSVETFFYNHKNSSTILGDIKKISPKTIRDLLGETKIDVLIAGIPCQGFSLNNRKRHENDERNFLFKEFVRFAKELKPKAIMVENVSGLRTLANGKFVEDIESAIKEATGMFVTHKLLYAPDYGVPQKRQRLVFIGTYNREFDFDDIVKTHGTPMNPYVTVKDAIYDLPRIESGQFAENYVTIPESKFAKEMRKNQKILHNHVAPKHPSSTIKKIMQTAPGEPMYKRYKQRIRLKWDDLSPTQVSGGIRPQFQFGHPEIARGLTIRERCRLQSFPDDFVIKGGTVQGRVQTGNAVPPLLAKAIAKALLKYL